VNHADESCHSADLYLLYFIDRKSKLSVFGKGKKVLEDSEDDDDEEEEEEVKEKVSKSKSMLVISLNLVLTGNLHFLAIF